MCDSFAFNAVLMISNGEVTAVCAAELMGWMPPWSGIHPIVSNRASAITVDISSRLANRHSMEFAGRYGGSSRLERSLAASMSAVIVLLFLLAFGRGMQGGAPKMSVPIDQLITFTITAPPVRPVALDWSQTVHRSASASAPHAARVGVSANPEHVPYFAAPVDLVPLKALPPNDIAVPLISDLPQLDVNNTDGGGPDSGRGRGAGAGKGSTRPVKLMRADWIKPPGRDDFEREWRRSGLDFTMPVEVVLLCDVHKDGHPFDCVVARESLPGKGFGAAAIRLVHGSRIRPMTIDDKRVDIRVIVPISFTSTKADFKPPHPQPAAD